MLVLLVSGIVSTVLGLALEGQGGDSWIEVQEVHVRNTGHLSLLLRDIMQCWLHVPPNVSFDLR